MGAGLKRARAAAKATRTKTPLQRDIEAFVRDVTKVGSMSKSAVVARLRPLMEQGFREGYRDASRAYGGCAKCYGKGYATTLEFVTASSDFPDHKAIKRNKTQLPIMRPCSCPRGKQIKALMSGVEKGARRV